MEHTGGKGSFIETGRRSKSSREIEAVAYVTIGPGIERIQVK